MTGWTAERIRDARARHAERLDGYDHDCGACLHEVEPEDGPTCTECMEPGSDHWTLSGDYSDGADLPEALDEIERMRVEIAAWRRAARGLVPGEMAKRLDRMEMERDASRERLEEVEGKREAEGKAWAKTLDYATAEAEKCRDAADASRAELETVTGERDRLRLQPADPEGVAPVLLDASRACQQAIDAIVRIGHTDHCARRLAWGDGECECSPTTK